MERSILASSTGRADHRDLPVNMNLVFTGRAQLAVGRILYDVGQGALGDLQFGSQLLSIYVEQAIDT